MSYTIYITKTRQSSGLSDKITSEEFEKMVEEDEELIWLEESEIIGDEAKSYYAPRSVAIWQYGPGPDDNLWFDPKHGTMDFGYRGNGNYETDDLIQKIFEVARKLNCYVENEDGEILYDPAE